MNTVINGAGGWLGRSTAYALERSGLLTNNRKVSLFGQSNRIVDIGPWQNARVNSLDEFEKVQGETSLFVQLAFKTRDYIGKLGEQEYIRANREILKRSIELLKRSEARSVVVVSSGVVKRYFGSGGLLDDTAYTKLKIEEEQLFAETCATMESRLLVLRMWGSSGEDMTEPLKYAIGDLIRQSFTERRISVNSSRLVYRRYLDSRDQMEVAIRASLEKGELTIDSGGEIVEMGQLAGKIRDIFSPGKEILRPKIIELEPDLYFSTSTSSEMLASKYGIPLLSLEQQLIETSRSVVRVLKR
jgi:nucleoside-diphosphate-sugar epimerase